MLRPEEIDHINLINWFHYEFPDFADDFHHFANEHYLIPKEDGSHWQAGRKRKKMGVKKGVWDFFLAVPLDGYAGLWIELKVGTNKLTKEQEEFGKRKLSRGYCVAPAWGLESGKKVLLNYLKYFVPFSLNN